MPLYEYECEACSTRIEKIQKFSDPPPATCEACGGPLRKLFSSPAIQFKGSGWYITDYAKKTAVEGTTGASKTSGESQKSDASPADTGKSDSSTSASSKGQGSGGGGSGASGVKS
jgi:putative FmdB family regulatory protein